METHKRLPKQLTLAVYVVSMLTILLSSLILPTTHAAPSSPANLNITGNNNQPTVSWDPATTPQNGVVWNQETANAGWSGRAEHSSVVFDGKMWVMGGYGGGGHHLNDVWYSEDGATWHQATDNAAWPGRRYYASVVFDNKMWVMGGYDASFNSLNDVWYSEDGTTWHQATDNASWSARGYFSSVTFDNKLWVIGGSEDGNNNVGDIWYSEDGTTWYQATDSPAWSVHSGHSSVVFNNAMWIMGGWGGVDGCGIEGYCNDTWYSQDGVDWYLATDSPGWPERAMHTSVVFDNKLWVIGGEGDDEQCGDNSGFWLCNDVWWSEDGENWTRATDNAPWDERGYHTSIVLNEQLYVIGGHVGVDWDRSNDVWTTPNQSISHYQVCWDTAEGGCTNSAKVSPEGSVLAAHTGTDSWLTKLGQSLGILPASASAQVSQLSYTLPSLTPGTYHISVTAVDYQGQSTSSGQVLSHTVTASSLQPTGTNTIARGVLALGIMALALYTFGRSRVWRIHQ